MPLRTTGGATTVSPSPNALVVSMQVLFVHATTLFEASSLWREVAPPVPKDVLMAVCGRLKLANPRQGLVLRGGERFLEDK